MLRPLCDEYMPGSLVISLLIAILPVLIPEIREWVQMKRDKTLEDRLSQAEQEIEEMRERLTTLENRPARPRARKRKSA